MKKVRLKLVGLNGNAFNLLGQFAAQARREKWTQGEIDAVMAKATSGDYHRLLATLADHCENPAGDEDDDEEDIE